MFNFTPINEGCTPINNWLSNKGYNYPSTQIDKTGKQIEITLNGNDKELITL